MKRYLVGSQVVHERERVYTIIVCLEELMITLILAAKCPAERYSWVLNLCHVFFVVKTYG